MPRLFIALDLPPEIKQSLLQLPRAYAGARWQTSAQMHITLVFIGDLDKSRMPELVETLSEITAEPLNLALKGVDYFGSNRYPRVLFANVEKNSALEKLQKQVYKAVAAIDIELERKKYIPHVTLARLDRTPYESVGQFLESEALFKTESFSVAQFHLYSSKQTRAGSEYRIEASFPFDREIL
jgi:2'-5' RNA ligase